jgi:hypothetical protein
MRLYLDVSERATVAASLQHDYLITGLLSIPSLDEEDFDTAAVSADDQQTVINPNTLHLHDPLILPKGKDRGNTDAEEQLWARRQFSVLWAPMPADYNMVDGQVSEASNL